MRQKLKFFLFTGLVVVAIPVIYLFGVYNGQMGQEFPLVGKAQAAGGKVTDPKGTAPNRYVYYPGTGVLAEDEVRVIACGTGMPEQRRGAASACFFSSSAMARR